MLRADEGWMLGAVDKAQAESYCTGYISQDMNLIHVVNTSPDFHCQNASMFFGIPFEKLFDKDYVCPKTGEKGKKLNKPIRDIAKRVNHGANYNMGPDVLVDTMGVKEIIKARKLLRLPMVYKPKDVATYLLAKFDETYPKIRKDWYQEVITEIVKTGKLYVEAVGWTRRTFLRPLKSKLDLNAAVAHKPQSTSVHLVNKALVKIWRELQIKKYRGKFRLKAQVHDEIVFQTRPEILDTACHEVADIMVIPTVIEGRTMTIPSTIAKGYYWSEAK
jgi:DNA polymerase I-like protein with 3'-5' exonuclease and polymerase domains